MEFKNAGKRFRVKMKKEDGTSFSASLQSPTTANKRSSFSEFRPEKRTLFADSGVNLKAGDVFITPRGKSYMCAYNGESEYAPSDLITFLAIPVFEKKTWQRKSTEIDPITGIAKDESTLDLGLVWVSIEDDGQRNDTIKVAKPQYKLITNVPLMLGDIIGEKYTVKRVDFILGVTVADVE